MITVNDTPSFLEHNACRSRARPAAHHLLANKNEKKMALLRRVVLHHLALLGLVALGQAYPEEDNVVVLDPKNFDAFIAEHPLALVEFCAVRRDQNA